MRRLYFLSIFLLLLLSSCQEGIKDDTDFPDLTPSPVQTATFSINETSESEKMISPNPGMSLILELQNANGLSNGPIYSLDWSPDGSRIAAAGYERVDLWDVETEQEIIRLQEIRGFVWGVDWSPDGNWVAAASDGGMVQVWGAEDGQVTQTFQIPGAFCLNWSPDGEQIAAGTKSGQLYLLDIASGEIASQTSTNDLIIAVKWSPDGSMLAVGKLNGEVEIYDAASLELLQTFDEDTGTRRDANGLDWSPDGTLLASAHQDGAIRIWKVASGELLLSFRANYHWVRGIAWSPDGRIIAAGGDDTTVRLWDAATGDLLVEEQEHSLPVWSVVWSPDGRFIASGEGVYDSSDCHSDLFIWEIQE